MTYSEILNEILSLDRTGFDFFTLGRSGFNQPIYAAHTGSYEGKQEIVIGAMHAREYVTAPLVVKLAEYALGKIESGGIYFIPLTNPDGVRLVLEGDGFLPCEAARNLTRYANNGSSDYTQWKADGYAVDLNTNFAADWGQGNSNVFCPAPQSFVGYFPESERETRLLTEFSQSVYPAVALSFHTKGEVIYYGFTGESASLALKSRTLAKRLAADAGYLAFQSTGSTGGYKDWCVRNLKIPAFTVETGADTLSHPVSAAYLDDLFARTKNLPLLALSEV